MTVRIDTGVFEGANISIHYDPMISKLCTHAPTRGEAIEGLNTCVYLCLFVSMYMRGCECLIVCKCVCLGEQKNACVKICWYGVCVYTKICVRIYEEMYVENFYR